MELDNELMLGFFLIKFIVFIVRYKYFNCLLMIFCYCLVFIVDEGWIILSGVMM